MDEKMTAFECDWIADSKTIGLIDYDIMKGSSIFGGNTKTFDVVFIFPFGVIRWRPEVSSIIIYVNSSQNSF